LEKLDVCTGCVLVRLAKEVEYETPPLLGH